MILHQSPTLLLCRTDAQWKDDNLGGRQASSREKIVINPRSLSRQEFSCVRGRSCAVWQGVWRTGKEKKVVALKQLHHNLQNTHQNKFLDMCSKSLNWDDASLIR